MARLLGRRAPSSVIRRCRVFPVSIISSTSRICFPSSRVSGSYSSRTVPLETFAVAVGAGHQEIDLDRPLDLCAPGRSGR